MVLNPNDFTYPAPGILESPDKIKQYLKDRGQYGGTFGDLLVGYLTRKNPKDFPKDPGIGDSSKARPLVPPSLIGQGERTRPEWLYEFLMNPFPVRKMSILRMPKFNLSGNDAQSLVDYFAAIERQHNPGIGLTYPYEQNQSSRTPPARHASNRNRRNTSPASRSVKTTAAGKDTTLFDKRVGEMTPIWQAVLKDYEGQKASIKASQRCRRWPKPKTPRLKARNRHSKNGRRRQGEKGRCRRSQSFGGSRIQSRQGRLRCRQT